jgi:hypothetical protein
VTKETFIDVSGASSIRDVYRRGRSGRRFLNLFHWDPGFAASENNTFDRLQFFCHLRQVLYPSPFNNFAACQHPTSPRARSVAEKAPISQGFGVHLCECQPTPLRTLFPWVPVLVSPGASPWIWSVPPIFLLKLVTKRSYGPEFCGFVGSPRALGPGAKPKPQKSCGEQLCPHRLRKSPGVQGKVRGFGTRDAVCR